MEKGCRAILKNKENDKYDLIHLRPRNRSTSVTTIINTESAKKTLCREAKNS